MKTACFKRKSTDRYDADLNLWLGYANLDFHFGEKISGNAGVRFERDEINVLWDVANYVGRVGSIKKEYSELYPSLNLKYDLNEKHSITFCF